jgi:hypothetical protein
MPQSGESRTSPGVGITPEEELWAHVLWQAIADSLSTCGGGAVERARARRFLAQPQPGRDLRLLLEITGLDVEGWPRILRQLERAWQLCDSLIEARAHGPGRGSHEPHRLLRSAREAHDLEVAQRRQRRLEQARAGWRQALERCGYSADLGCGSYLGTSEGSRAS